MALEQRRANLCLLRTLVRACWCGLTGVVRTTQTLNKVFIVMLCTLSMVRTNLFLLSYINAPLGNSSGPTQPLPHELHAAEGTFGAVLACWWCRTGPPLVECVPDSDFFLFLCVLCVYYVYMYVWVF